METLVYQLVKILHLLSMAVWFGVPLLITNDIKSTIHLGEDKNGLSHRVNYVLLLSKVFGLITIITGFVLIFQLGGFASIKPTIHVGLLLTLIIYANLFIFISPVWKKLYASYKAGDQGTTTKSIKKMSMWIGMEHGLKLITLILMVIR